jgi:hypothetical protein
LMLYAWSSGDVFWKGTGFSYHSWQAAAWLHGHLWLPNVTGPELDLTPYAGHWYSAFPPLPALVMLPFALIWGASANQAMVFIIVGALNVVLMRLVMARLSRYYFVSRATQLLSTLFFGLGTVTWHSVIQGTVWNVGHACVLALLLLALVFGLDGGRPLLTGALVGLAGLSRPTAWLSLVFWLVIWFKRRQAHKSGWSELPRLLLGPFLAVLATFAYNWLRFRSLTDFGYLRMNAGKDFQGPLAQYGQFHPHFFPKNFYYAFLNLPEFHFGLPVMQFDLTGNSLLFTSPALLIGLLALRHLKAGKQALASWSGAFTLGAGLAVVATLLPLLMYYTTGRVQFGYRFIQDCLPFLIILVGLGWPQKRRWQIVATALVLVSILITAYGTFWFQNWWPELFGVVKR